MNCGSCLRFKTYGAMDGTLGHCMYAGKNVNTSDPACEGHIDEKTLDVFERLFLNRVDTYAEQLEDGQYIRREEPLTTEVLKRHLAGEITAGTYQIEPTGNVVKWLCFDVDPERTKTPHKIVAQICDLVKQSFTEKSMLLEASRHPDPSFHVWVFFAPEIPAKVPRVLGAKILEKVGVDVEVFPKQDEVKQEDFGNLVKLPLGLHRKNKKWSCFLDPSTMEPLATSCLSEVEGTTLTEKEIEKVMALSRKEEKVWFERDDLAGQKYKGKDPACIQGILKGVSEGWRNEAALRLTSFMANFKRLKHNTVWKRLLEWNKQNQPPLGERELDSIFNSTIKGEYIFGCDDELLQKFCVREGCSLAKVPSRGDYFDDRGKFIPKLLADEIMVYETFVTLMDSKETYVWREGYYQPLGAIVIEQHCKDLLQEEFRKNRFGEVSEYIKASTFINVHEPPRNLINLENGVLDIETNELKSHDPNHVFFNKMNVEYDPTQDASLISKFFRDIAGSEEDVLILEETVGYCLYRDYPYAKALALVGEGANGKSTFLALIKEFLGHRNVSGKGLNDLEFNRFAKASLFGKLANIYADLSDDTLKKTGMFKMLTGGDVIEAEKKFRDSFTFVNYAKLLFSCNKLPEVYDNTDAFFRRWLIVTFPNVFKGENCDPYILEKLTVPQELSGLLNMALKGLKRILENRGFSYSKSTEEIREDYIRKSDPLAAFILDCIEEDQDVTLLKQELYSLFAFYCRENNLPAVNKDTFFKNISKHVSVTQVRIRRKGIPGRPYGYQGINLTKKGEKLRSKGSKGSTLFSTLIIKQAPSASEKNIKVGKTLDPSDPKPTTCWICHKALLPDQMKTEDEMGKPVHTPCLNKLKFARKSDVE